MDKNISMTKSFTKIQKDTLNEHRIGRLATVDEGGKPLVLPVCFTLFNNILYTPIDKKPKKVTTGNLRRLKNISINPYVSIVFDGYYEDWTRLYYIIVEGQASVIGEGEEYKNSLQSLVQKYDQYRKMGLLELGLPVIKIKPEKIICWGN